MTTSDIIQQIHEVAMTRRELRTRPGWKETKTATVFLGAPDMSGNKPNDDLFRRSRVMQAEEQPIFARVVEKERAQEAALAAEVHRRRHVAVSHGRRAALKSKDLTLTEVYHRAVLSFNENAALEGQPSNASVRSERRFLNRLAVNWLRHQRSDYDALNAEGAGSPDSKRLTEAARRVIYADIADTYPALRVECERQMSEKSESV